MSRKDGTKKLSRSETALTPEELQKLNMIMDRLAVQDPEGSSLDNCLKSLIPVLSGKEHLIAALLDQLSKKPSKVGFEAYLKLKDLVHVKQFQKIVRQAAYRFSQKGFGISESSQAAEPIVLVPKEDRQGIAHAIPVAGTFWLFAALIPDSRRSFPTFVVAGIMEEDFKEIYIKIMEGSQKIYREYLKKAAEVDPERKPYPIPLYHAARLYFEMLEWRREQTESFQVSEARRLLSPYYDPHKLPHPYTLMPAIEHPDRDMREIHMDEFSDKVPLRMLIIPKDDLVPYWQKVQELEASVLVVSPEVKEERVGDIIKKAGDELVVGRRRLIYQRFLEEQSLWLKLTGEDKSAIQSWIMAQHLRGSYPASENKFVLGMVVLSLQHHWGGESEKAKGSDSYRSEGGLILPSWV